MDFYTKNRSDKNYKNERKINYSMIINAYLNLLFCYSLNSEWLKMNFVLNEISKRQLPLSSDQKIKLENFRIESLINLNKIEEAQSVISKSLDSYANENYKFDFYYIYNQKIDTILARFYFRSETKEAPYVLVI